MINNLLITTKDKRVLERVLKILNINVDDFVEINNLREIKQECLILKQENEILKKQLENVNGQIIELCNQVNDVVNKFYEVLNNDLFNGGDD